MTRALSLLFWLKWKLTLRGYLRSRSALLGGAVLLLVLLPFAVGLAFFCGIGFLDLPPPLNSHLLRAALLGLYLIWLFAPLLGYALSDSYDVTRLFVYPVTMRQILVGAICSSLLDMPTLLFLPIFLAVFVGFAHDPLAFVLIACAAGLFLFHTLSLTQSILLATAGILRSRRFRDIAIVLIPLLWIGYYVSSQTLARQAGRVDWQRFLHSDTWEFLNFLPPGLAARAIAAAGQGQIGESLGFLLLLAAVTAGTVFLAAWFLKRVYGGQEISWRRPARPSSVLPRSALQPAAVGRLSRLLPPTVQAIIDKEVRYFFRDPYFKIALSNLVYVLFVAVFAFLNPAGRIGLQQLGPVVVWAATGVILLSEMQLVCNIFGMEGGASTLLFLFPCPRYQILVGKNMALFTALSVVNLIFMLVLAAAARVLAHFGLLFCWMELALIVFVAVGNLASIYYPYRQTMRGWRIRQQSSMRGCGYTFLYLGLMAIAFVVLLPVLVALLGPQLWNAPAWLAVTIPLAIAYVFLVYGIALRSAAPLLIQREPDILEKIAREE